MQDQFHDNDGLRKLPDMGGGGHARSRLSSSALPPLEEPVRRAIRSRF
jgi:hypothetical protein